MTIEGVHRVADRVGMKGRRKVFLEAITWRVCTSLQEGHFTKFFFAWVTHIDWCEFTSFCELRIRSECGNFEACGFTLEMTTRQEI
jgi:hypothetical protein